jgi:hypothetical protein
MAPRGPSLYDKAANKLLTLYSLMDYIVPQLDVERLRNVAGLTDEQLRVVLDYYHAHREQLDADYREILADAQAREAAWDEQHHDVVAEILARRKALKNRLHQRQQEQSGQ